MFKVKGQDGGVYEVEKIYPRHYATYAKTHYFLMGDDVILGIFETEKSCNRILKNFLTWYSSPTTNTTIFTIAQDDNKFSESFKRTDSKNLPIIDDEE
jgi:hypothetical protein